MKNRHRRRRSSSSIVDRHRHRRSSSSIVVIASGVQTKSMAKSPTGRRKTNVYIK
ncbi:MAG: hypothetical protein K0U52_12645 [Gammaproteobacteria bacterium]|nr:hypothetical protein [Gammaproteobacteria bacterium]